MIWVVLASLVLGVLCGQWEILPQVTAWLTGHTGEMIFVLVFLVGVSLSGSRETLFRMRNHGPQILAIPCAITAASLLSGPVCCLLTGVGLRESMATVSGLGWSSLTGVLVTELSGPETGAMAFLANLLRGELLTYCLIPIVARRVSYPAVLALGGATCLDTTLPMIMEYTDEETTLMGVASGLICSFLVPLLIQACWKIWG
jgi:uncharacterized membrane protein YbjE (DUF340 family)